MKKVLPLFFFFCYWTSFLGAQTQGMLSGKVLSREKEPLIGATVLIQPQGSGTVTDNEGGYVMEDLTEGTYTVTASYLGYESISKSIKIKASTNNQLNFSLAESAKELEEVVIAAKSIKTDLETAGYAVSAVEMKDVELQSIQTNEVLDRSSGVRIRQNGGLGSRVQYNINGLSGSAIRIFIDGSPIQSYGPSFSLSSIPPNMIERIEVYKGVVPIELAGDALGGAINVILKKNLNRNTLSASYSFGSFHTHQVSASGAYYEPKSGLTVKGSGFYNYSDNNYDVWGNQVYTTEPATGEITYLRAKRFHDTYVSGGFKMDAGISGKNWADELLVGAVYSNLERDIQHGATMESVYGKRKAYQQTQLISLSYKDKSFFSDKLNLEIFSSYSKLNRLITDTTAHIYDWDGKRKEKYDANGDFTGWYEYISGAEAGTPTLEESKESVYLGRATIRYQMDSHQKITGNFLHTRFIRDSHDPLKHVDIRNLEDTRFSNQSVIGLGYELKVLQERLKLSAFYKHFLQDVQVIEYKKENNDAGIELNNVNREVQADGIGFALAYQLFPHILLLTSAERSFRMPASRELFGNLAENLEPNYGLKPEKSKNLNLGIALGTFDFGRHQARFQINTFIRDTKDKIKRNVREDDTDETTEYINDDSYISKGFDLDFFYSFDRKLDFTSNLSVFNSLFNTQFDETGLPYDWYRDRERNAPFFTANANLRYRKANLLQEGSKTTFSSNLGYVHWFYRDWESLGATGKDIIPTQLVFDLGITYAFPGQKLTLALDARNIFDHQVFDNYALQKAGRAFYAKINYRIL